MSTCRVFAGIHPSRGAGFWVAKPGFDAYNNDGTSRDQFYFSSSFPGRVPIRLIAAGQATTNQAIYLPNSLGNLGYTPVLVYRPMTGTNTERQTNYYGVTNDGAGGSYSGTELFNRLYDGNPAYFGVYINGNTGSTGVLIKFWIFAI
ncbi:hypothetical protein [Methylobacterium gnaphalii]|uniref:Uncharacterized protein n=1 Tax=Methylobacterium gnaphalii TaxID=1010610 RepID=A0A512JMB5_9HYPH|nr:hypothetical protein [Methylobacterium gnaphalii]GEP11111.1 hypothetical protein MGN01_29560 [Methylobacterium gnaphalii]GJD69901.1 hypothetical protein MMMDOFMJ_2840 [Methylobacterium gnaphalii]GLS50389.1 hypothetical protein GCM10007885_32410 [Methylobacterium gnaphalii]